MLFNSSEYLILVAVSLLIYYRVQSVKWQTSVIFIASLVFYGWSQFTLLVLLLASASITAITSFQVLTCEDARKRRTFASVGVAANMLTLATFKYSGLLAETLWIDTTSIGRFMVSIPLPIGISFYTFQGVSLMLDTLRGEVQLDRSHTEQGFRKHCSRTFLFIAFFPQLVAGPIVKGKEFFPQIRLKEFSDVDLYSCARTLTVGYFLKVFVADNLHNHTFWLAYPYFRGLSSEDGWLLLFAYSIQIFADFAGYSAIAIGSARLFGYELPQNFNFPYVADSFSDFWRRWHISLSTWLRDYLYIPLGGNRLGEARTYANLILVMALGGLWHGASWSYMSWGLVHGVLLAAERPLRDTFLFRSRALRPFRIFGVFWAVTLCWTFFRLPRFEHAVDFFSRLLFSWDGSIDSQRLAMIGYFALPVVLYHAKSLARISIPPRFEELVLALMIFLILTNGGTSQAFIYFQF